MSDFVETTRDLTSEPETATKTPTVTLSVAQTVANHIASLIIKGELVDGERIQEVRFCSTLGVSRGSMREALLILERSYLIEVYPHRGAIVAPISVHHIKQLFETTSLILSHMIERASLTWRVPENEQIEAQLNQLKAMVNAPAQRAQLPQEMILFYDHAFSMMSQTKEMVNNIYLTDMYARLLPALQRSYGIALVYSPCELEEALSLFEHAISHMLLRQSQVASKAMEAFCLHLSSLVLKSIMRMKQIELALAKRQK